MAAFPIIELTGVEARYGERVALGAVDIAIDAGSFVALVGPSGSGKTTLLKTINGLIPATAGTIRVDGRAIGDLPPELLRRGIGYAFQGIGLFPHMTVAENIWIVPRLSGASEDKREARIAELLAMVGLPTEMAGRYPAALSGGQAQRIGFARALAARPAIMLMDEPFGALDPVTRDEIATAYRALHDSLGLTTLMVTHDMTEALLLADRVIALDAGSIIADAAPAALLEGHSDPAVAALVAVPRRQAARLDALEKGA